MTTPDGLGWPRSLLNAKVYDRWVGAFPSCINSFIDCLLEEREPYVTVLDGWKAAAILDALHLSGDI